MGALPGGLRAVRLGYGRAWLTRGAESRPRDDRAGAREPHPPRARGTRIPLQLRRHARAGVSLHARSAVAPERPALRCAAALPIGPLRVGINLNSTTSSLVFHKMK